VTTAAVPVPAGRSRKKIQYAGRVESLATPALGSTRRSVATRSFPTHLRRRESTIRAALRRYSERCT
jgi:hypothetical protein